jgi:hypothetical protein
MTRRLADQPARRRGRRWSSARPSSCVACSTIRRPRASLVKSAIANILPTVMSPMGNCALEATSEGESESCWRPKHTCRSVTSRKNVAPGSDLDTGVRSRRAIDYKGIRSSSRPTRVSKLRPTGNQTWPFRRARPCVAKRFKVIPTALTWKSRCRTCVA